MRVKKRQLSDAYRFDGFRPEPDKVRGMFGAPQARILPLKRRSKKHDAVNAVPCVTDGTTEKPNLFATCRVVIRTSIWRSSSDVWTAGIAAK